MQVCTICSRKNLRRVTVLNSATGVPCRKEELEGLIEDNRKVQDGLKAEISGQALDMTLERRQTSEVFDTAVKRIGETCFALGLDLERSKKNGCAAAEHFLQQGHDEFRKLRDVQLQLRERLDQMRKEGGAFTNLEDGT